MFGQGMSDYLRELQEGKDEAYRQRNHLVAAIARLFPSGIRATNIEGWESDWHGCVYIDLPAGQISYHYHDSQAHLFADLPPYTREYDGHDKEAVHERLSSLRADLMKIGREIVADWMILRGYSPGHEDSIQGYLWKLEAQAREQKS